MAGLVYINEEEGKKRVMNNAKLYVKLLAKFKADISLRDLLASVENQDWEKAKTDVHAIKGIAANLSLTELFNQALNLEGQLHGANLKPESMDNLKICFAETLAEVEKVIARNS